jgi:hypothetical protein
MFDNLVVKEPMKFVDPGEHPSDKFETELEKPEPIVEKTLAEQHPYLNQPFDHFKNLTPMVHKPEPVIEEKTVEEILDEGLKTPAFQLIPELQEELKKTEWPTDPEKGDRCVMFVDDANRNFIFNGDVWIDADHSDPSAVNALDESKKKSTYMIKDQDQQITKTKE